jgi:hypothetical protein
MSLLLSRPDESTLLVLQCFTTAADRLLKTAPTRVTRRYLPAASSLSAERGASWCCVGFFLNKVSTTAL